MYGNCFWLYQPRSEINVAPIVMKLVLHLPMLLLSTAIIISFPSRGRVLYKTLYYKVSQIHAAGFILVPRLPLSI